MNIGNMGEAIAQKHLSNNGYRILEKNFRTCFGEIDIIATKNNQLIFFEVKTRTSINYGLPCEAINSIKQEKIKKVASFYLLEKNINEYTQIRIDVLEILLKNDKSYIRHMKNAF